MLFITPSALKKENVSHAFYIPTILNLTIFMKILFIFSYMISFIIKNIFMLLTVYHQYGYFIRLSPTSYSSISSISNFTIQIVHSTIQNNDFHDTAVYGGIVIFRPSPIANSVNSFLNYQSGHSSP